MYSVDDFQANFHTSWMNPLSARPSSSSMHTNLLLFICDVNNLALDNYNTLVKWTQSPVSETEEQTHLNVLRNTQMDLWISFEVLHATPGAFPYWLDVHMNSFCISIKRFIELQTSQWIHFRQATLSVPLLQVISLQSLMLASKQVTSPFCH